ncbi:MAG: DUF3416 domain-containing protein [Pseudomonadota bacterium]|nr:DUF3416 domain-containing protein [Pseudomonadota bacterium]
MNRARSVRACYLNPSLLRPIKDFDALFRRCAQLGFSEVVLPCPFVADSDWKHARLSDPDRLAPVFGWSGNAADGLSKLAKTAKAHNLGLVLDLRLDEVAADSPVVSSHPDCFRPQRNSDGPAPDPRQGPAPASAAVARFRSQPAALVDWWQEQLGQWCAAGVTGFRCLWPQRVPPAQWRALIEAVGKAHDAEFMAWTPGLEPRELQALSGCGFTAAFSSLAWWDYQSSWYLEEDERLRAFPSAISVVDIPLADGSGTCGLGGHRPRRNDDETSQAKLARTRALEFAAATGDGLMVVLHEDDDTGLEVGIRDANAVVAARSGLDRTNARRKSLSPLLGGSGGPAAAWLIEPLGNRASGGEPANPDATRLLLVNTDLRRVAASATRELLRNAGRYSAFEPLGPAQGSRLDASSGFALEPGEVRLYTAVAPAPVQIPVGSRQTVEQAAASPRIALEAITPSVDGGRFPAKRTVGEQVTVHADVLCDGHDRVAAAVLWRAAGQSQWRQSPMRHLGNDRWVGEFTLDRLGRHEFTVEAWRDEFATARMDLEKKRAADKLGKLDVDEVCLLVSGTAEASGDAQLQDIVEKLDATDDMGALCDLLVAPQTATAMARADRKAFLTRCSTVFPLDAERRGAGYSSWYELFPRSQSTAGPDGLQLHGRFDDVIGRLPAIREMGFDVLYMPPIHPIGQSNRKGRNNSVTAVAGEPGSPYAIGAEAGGHDAIHPELGTLEDFRRLVQAAAAEGLELALDFAIQCSPDHPWLRDHPDWFAWRADGSIRYAENPPKKYEDIVNVDFYAKGAIPDLWVALRDVVAFWVNEGVRLFRVDNPHTKPFPFWEWMIGDIRATHPDVVFLSEAFTRPKLMYRLAKVGYSQSYTYFTWRNTKAELTGYLTELADGPERDFFRPHFFVNTPDINPVFLHHSGRPGHLIRAALATTLSGLWGMYSGFELCEATPIKPGKEEYLDSEKYQLRDWDWQRPGNIVAEITRLNWLRRLHPALQTHLGVKFYNAFNDNILYFGKRRSEHEDMILVAVNLDPHHAQEADFELPLWEFGLPDHASLQVEDLWRGTRSVWQGKTQHIRLDPAELPFAIWRIGTGHGGPQPGGGGQTGPDMGASA